MLAASSCGRIAPQASYPIPTSVSSPPSATPFLPAGFAGLPSGDDAHGAPTEPPGTTTAEDAGQSIPSGEVPVPLDLAAVLETINRIRAREGVGSLRVSPTLAALAQARANELAATEGLWHVEPGSGLTPDHALIEAGFSGALAEHTVAVSVEAEDPAGVVLQAVLTDPAHRRNLLAPQFSLTGLGLADDGEWLYLVQLLAEGGPSDE
jgi:uncharacterized protein YkwD